MSNSDLTIKFKTREEMLAFCGWLCTRGEQDYWEWCENPNPKHAKPAVAFNYHSKAGFVGDNTIRTRALEREPVKVGPCCQKCQSANTIIDQECIGFTTWVCTDCDHTSRQDKDC